MIDIETFRVSLPLKKKFAIAGGSTDTKTNIIAIMNNRYGGEGAASVAYGPSLDEIERDINKGAAYIKRRKKLDVSVLEAISEYKINSIARSALTGMVLNYLSGEARRYPWEVVSLGAPIGIRNSITISIADPAEVIQAINESDFPIIKIKMGGARDAELIPLLSAVTGKEIRIDANGGWSPEVAEEMIQHLAGMNITVIEQPTSTDHIADWKHLKGKNESVVLIIDEGLNSLADYEQLAEHCDGINIKMEKAGGIIEAARIARRAREDKKKVMLGCMVESSVGIAQSIYMSSLADYHDLDAPQLLEQDIAQGVIYDRDTIHVDAEIIGGPALKRDLLEKFIRE